MSRWHAVSCRAPDVVLDNKNWPLCKACYKTCPSIDQLLENERAEGYSVLTLPPDEPPEQMNLWWPLTVPYITPDGKRPTVPSETDVTSRTSEESPATTACYGDTLRNDEFRLAILSAVDKDDQPVHITLEIFTHNSHPEYETVSYLWGGEDGDSTLRKPVFVGPYWDVSLQTNNCFSMLRFVRPWRGIRVLWIDSLCINQRNLEERGAQVAAMGGIYKGCSRVIVYLGDDIATASRRFPTHRPLHEIQVDADELLHPVDPGVSPQRLGLRQLLRRKYFGRVWMIQELVLSERALIRVGDIDYRADAHIMSKILGPSWKPDSVFEWEKSDAPWVQHLAQGALNSGSTVADVLKFTLRSHSSDPRDKLFGVMPLVYDENLRLPFTPNYTLSYQQFCVGILSHWLLKDKDLSLLYKARSLCGGSTALSKSLPSWLPEFEAAEFWNDILSSARIPYQASSPKNRDSWVQDIIKSENPNRVTVFYYESSHKTSETTPELIFDTRPWHLDSHISAHTGTLSVNLTHLFTFEKRPVLLPENVIGAETGLCFEVGSKRREGYLSQGWAASKMYLTSRTRLDVEIAPGLDHLFILDSGDNEKPLIYLVLRKVDPDIKESRKFRLLASDLYLFEVQESKSTFRYGHVVGQIQKSVAESIECIASSEVVWDDWKILPTPPFVYNTTARVYKFPPRLFLQWRQLFPSIRSLEDLSPVFRSLILWIYSHEGSNERQRNPICSIKEERVLSWIFQVYTNFILGPKHKGSINNGFLELTFARGEWPDVRDFYISSGSIISYVHRTYIAFDWEIWYEVIQQSDKAIGGDEATPPKPFEIHQDSPRAFRWKLLRNCNDDFISILNENAPLHIRTRIPKVAEFIRKEMAPYERPLREISDSYEPPLDLSTVVDKVEKGPTEEQKYIGVPKLIGGVVVDGSTYQVEIS